MACCALVLMLVDAIRARVTEWRAARLRRAGRFDEATALVETDVRVLNPDGPRDPWARRRAAGSG